MMRKIMLLVASGIFALGALGAGITGSWSGKLTLLPEPALEEMTLSLGYTLAGWELSSTSAFENGAFSSQEFTVEGAIGPFQVDGSMSFSPVDEELEKISYVIPDAWTGFGYDLTYIDDHWVVQGPHFQKLSVASSLDFGGVSSKLEVSLEKNRLITIDADGNVKDYVLYLGFPSYIEDPEHTWTMQRDPFNPPDIERAFGTPYGKYFVSYGDIKLIATKVTFSGKDTKGNPVSYTLQGEFEVYYFDALTGQVILTPGAEAYVWQFINDYGSKHDWDLSTVTEYTVDPKDVEAVFLFPTYMTYTFTAEADSFKAEIVLDDVCTGIQFKEATISLSDLGLCCGVSFDFEAKFTKAHGFEYGKFSIEDLFGLCCGISFDADIEFGVDYKKVSITPKWEGIEGCVSVYGDVIWEDNALPAWELYGWKITCELAECNELEIVTAMEPSLFYVDSEGNLVVNPSSTEGLSPAFEDDEFEYIKASFCGSGCCGSNWNLGIKAFFTETSGDLFGMTRMAIEAKVPLMANLNLDISMEVPDTSMSIGWTFTF